MHQKNFAVKQHGSWEAAELEGRKWITEQKKILPPTRMNEEGRMTRRNRSGVVGVYLSCAVRRKPNGAEYAYWRWIACWASCPFKGGLTWTINDETSEDDAFALACLARDMRSIDRNDIRERLSDIYGNTVHLGIMRSKLLELV